MNIYPNRSFKINRSINEAIGGILNESLKNFVGSDTLASNVLANVLKSDKGFHIQLAVPGFTKQELDVEVTNGFVTVRAEATSGDSEQMFLRREFNRSDFIRTYEIPDKVDASKITASHEQGVLHLFLPLQVTLINAKIKIK